MKTTEFKLWLTSFLAGALIVLCVHIIMEVIDQPDAARSMSLGSMEVVKLDKKLGEQKIIMNDPSIQRNWGLNGTNGQSDIKANSAWGITQGDRQIIVAIVDTGVDVNHPDLASNIWTNKGEKPDNGIDDDGNGYIDDIHGWDFVNNKPYVTDNHGHGTHIAGIVGAVGGNGIGISGVCPKVSLMALKYYDPTARGNDNLRNTVKALKYATKMGAHIINYSGGGSEPDDEEFEAVKFAHDHGVLFIAAAGNEQSNSDVTQYYPADYNLPNIISVTAIDSLARVLRTSNYGTRSVHIAAPGEGIYSTLPKGQYGLMTGTSQATAFVTGVAALILAHNKDFNFEQVKKQILATADEIPGLRDKTSTSGKLNSYAALAIQPNIPVTGIARIAPAATSPVFSPEGSVGATTSNLNAIMEALKRPASGTDRDTAGQSL